MAKSRHCFSLIEVIIVIVIISLLVALATFLTTSSLATFQSEELKEKVKSLSKQARMTAQVQGSIQKLDFTFTDNNQWQISLTSAQEATEFTIDQDLKEQALAVWDPNAFEDSENLLLAKDWKLLNEEGLKLNESFSFSFFPDGQSSSQTLILETGEAGRQFLLSFDKFTGRFKWQEKL